MRPRKISPVQHFKNLDNEKPWFSMRELALALQGDPFWEKTINEVLSGHSCRSIHLAIFIEPYLQYILEGKKTVESRFSKPKIAPYERAKKGDIILLKATGGPIVGVCQISDVSFYELDSGVLLEIQREFTAMLCAEDPEFWKQRESAVYASLIRLKAVREIRPMKFYKTDRRGWIVIDDMIRQPLLPLEME